MAEGNGVLQLEPAAIPDPATPGGQQGLRQTQSRGGTSLVTPCFLPTEEWRGGGATPLTS